MRVGQFDWWFCNRHTGKNTIGQFPNWPLFAIGAGWVLRLVVAEQSTAYDLAGGTVTALWLYWGADEIVRGVNPWRRVLGGTAVVVNLAALLA